MAEDDPFWMPLGGLRNNVSGVKVVDATEMWHLQPGWTVWRV